MNAQTLMMLHGERMKSEFVEHTLANGLRIVMEVMPGVNSAAAGFLVRTGGRDEPPHLAGASHFLEHMCFKGTPNRTWRDITVQFDELGSTYNAYTMKDRTFYYGWVPAESIARQIELLADMMRSTLPADEFEMEKKVVLEEIAMSDDQIEHLAFDFLNEQVFPGHALSWPVLGYERTVRDMTRDQMNDFFVKHYAPNNLVLVAAGRIEPREIIDLADRWCGAWEAVLVPGVRSKPAFNSGASSKVYDRFKRQELAYVFPTPGGADPLDETAAAVVAILGGDNSRFFWRIVQEGIAPHAGVWRVDYEDCGLLVMSGECEPQRCEELTEAMHREALTLVRDGATEEEVQRVKNRRRTSLAVEAESPYYRLGQLLDDIEYRGEPRTVEQRLAEVDAVTPRLIADCLGRYPITNGGHFISVGPRGWLPAN